jgi:DNA polymerase-3 subunit gamma/tau
VGERIPDAKRCAELAAVYDSERIFSILDILTHYQAEMKYAAQPQILLEMALMKICTLEPDAPGGKREQTAPQADVLAALNRLAARVETLEKRLEESAASGGSASAGAAPLSGAYGAPAPAAGKPSPAASGRAKPAAGRIPAARMEQYARSADSAPFAQVRGKWPTVLQQVKEKKITVHAWLVDGEPVSALEDGVLVAFKNTIHRETTEKPANKQLIEQVLKEVMGRPLKLETVMQKEWMGVRTASSGGGEAAGPLQPEAEDAGEEEPEWVSAAIELFGEDMVTIKEE